jgi:4-amino-4-deoxy-L-arabinose transferase-like glycosyltransferase
MFGLPLADFGQTVIRRVQGRVHYLLLALLVGEGLMFVYYGNVNRDEGWYLYASRLVYEGHIPYRDFSYFQGPVLPYVYGLPQALLGPSLLIGRLTSLAFILIAILGVAYLAWRLAGHTALLWALLLMFVNPMLMYYCALARSEASVTALSVLTLGALFRFRKGAPALIVAPTLLLVASGIRLVLLPAFLGMSAFVWWSTPATKCRRLLAGGLLGLEALVIFGVPFLLAPRQALFGLWSSQVSRTNQMAPSEPAPGATFLAKVSQLEALWSTYLMVLVPAVALGAYLILRYYQGWQPRRPRFEGDPLSSYLLVLALALLIFGPNVMLSAVDTRYFVPSSALLTVAVAAAAVRLPGSANLPAFRSSFVLLLVALVLLGAAPYAGRYTQMLDVRNPDLVELRDVGHVLSSHLDDDEPFVTFDVTLAVAADRPVVRGLEMGQFSYWPAFSTDKAADLQVFNRDRLLQAIGGGGHRVVALTDYDLMLIGFFSTPNPQASLQEKPPFRVLPELKGWYSLAETVPLYGQLRENLYILVKSWP